MRTNLEKARGNMKILNLEETSKFNISQGCLEKFQLRLGIKSFHRFGKKNDTQEMEKNFKSIRKKTDQFTVKDIFNMD